MGKEDKAKSPKVKKTKESKAKDSKTKEVEAEAVPYDVRMRAVTVISKPMADEKKVGLCCCIVSHEIQTAILPSERLVQDAEEVDARSPVADREWLRSE